MGMSGAIFRMAAAEETKLSYTGPAELAARYGLSDELAARPAAIDAVTET
jgi:hypothetical protein